MEILIPILIITALILLNAIFVAAEFAIVGAPRASIERRAAEGERAAQLVHAILRDPRRQDRYIATAQLGITFASLGLGMYGEHILADWIMQWLALLGAASWAAAHAIASVISVAILTYFHIVIGEMVPKSLALSHAEQTALRITRPMLWVKGALFPLVVALNSVGNGLLRLMGIRRALGTGHFHSAEELQLIVEESARGGLLRSESGRVLRELFEFGHLRAGDAMVPRVAITGIPLGASPEELARIIKTSTHTRYPVFENDLDQIIGFLHVKDILQLLLEHRTLSRTDVRPAPFVPETAQLDTVINAMRRQRSHLAIVMDEHGGTAGLVTMEDLCDEIVGEIEENASERPSIQTEDPDRWRVAGSVRLEELGETLGVELAHEEIETVSGLVLTLLERPPARGDAVIYSGLRFQVSAVKGRGVKECVVTPQRIEETAQ